MFKWGLVQPKTLDAIDFYESDFGALYVKQMTREMKNLATKMEAAVFYNKPGKFINVSGTGIKGTQRAEIKNLDAVDLMIDPCWLYGKSVTHANWNSKYYHKSGTIVPQAGQS